MKLGLSRPGLKVLVIASGLSCSSVRSNTAWQTLYVRHIWRNADQIIAFHAMLCSRWVPHIWSGSVEKVTVSYECEHFSRKTWRIWYDDSSPFFYDTRRIPSGAVLHLLL